MLWRGRLTIAFGVSALALLCAQLLPSAPEAGSPHALGALDQAATPQAATSPAAETPSDPLTAAPLKEPETAAPPKPAALRLAAPAEVLGYVPVAHLHRAALHGDLARVNARYSETMALPGARPLHLEYTLDPLLTDEVFSILRRGRVSLGLALVLDVRTGDVLAYAGTDEDRLPAERAYPAASLVKIVTAAAALEHGLGSRTCRFVGSPYRLTPSRVVPPRRGTEITLERALATSNNQCFAQLAAGPLGAQTLLETISRFGLTVSPAPAHEAGRAGDPGDDPYLVGKLGCGLAGLEITALHAAELATVLADGTLPEVRWIARVTDADGHELALPQRRPARRVLDPSVARRLRQMMIETTLRGTARSAFRRHARGMLGNVPVAAKTGSLTGEHPAGHYEWFVAAAPADHPRIALAVLVVQPHRHWSTSGAQAGAQILNSIFCEHRTCNAALADRFGVPAPAVLRSGRVQAQGVAQQDAPARRGVQRRRLE